VLQASLGITIRVYKNLLGSTGYLYTVLLLCCESDDVSSWLAAHSCVGFKLRHMSTSQSEGTRMR
jgi:hypothetical protein